MAKLRDKRIYEFEGFRLDAAQMLLYRNGEEVSLTPKAIETLLALIERRGEIVSKSELMQKIWADTVVEESNLSQYLHVLRKTLGAAPDGKSFIETLKRRGYRFNAAVCVSENSDGFSPQMRAGDEEIGNFKTGKTNGRQSKVSDSRFPHVERRGNVLALADWWENEKKLDEIERAVEQNEDRRHYSTLNSKSRFAILAACVALFLTAISFVWFKSASSAKLSAAKGETTVLNLTNGANVSHATISPDGKYFVYVEQEVETAHLWLQQVGGANRVEIIEPFRGVIHGLTFAPDSQSIYFLAFEKTDEPNALYRVPTLGGVPTRILTDLSQAVSFSPDGSEMIFVRDYKINESQLVAVASDGTRERVLLTSKNPEIIVPNAAWSPDGKTIAFGLCKAQTVEGQCSIVGFDLASETTMPLSPEKWDTCYRMAWTPDGENLIFIGTKFGEAVSTRRDLIYNLSLNAGESRRLTADGSRYVIDSLGITADGAVLALPINRVSQIWALDAAGNWRTAIQITNGETDGRGGIAPLPDGRIGFLSRAGDSFGVWLMNADGTNRRELINDSAGVEELRAAPDGSFFVFGAKREGHNHLFVTDADGANRRQLTFGNSSETDSSVSPDGKWVIYDSFIYDGDAVKHLLLKVSSAGGASVPLSDKNCATPHFSPDGKFFSCVSSENEIIVMLSEDGSIVKSFAAAQAPNLNVGARWTPDGKALTYIVWRKNVSNIWIQPLDGSQPPRPLTAFTGGDIYNFAFSADGSRLYAAHGQQIQNAVLIKNFR